MGLFKVYPADEIEAIKAGKTHPNWVIYRMPRSYYAFIWGLLFIPFFFIMTTEQWWTIRVFVAGFFLPLFHAFYYKKTIEINIITTGFYMERIPEEWKHVKDFYARDMLKWIYSMYGQGINKFIKFGFKLASIFFLIGLGICISSVILPAMEFQLPVHEILFTIPERWRYLFSMFNVFSTDGAGLDIVRAQGYITYNFKEALMTDWRGWYVLLMFMPLMMIYIFQIVFFGIRIYMLGSFLHHFGYWHHEPKAKDETHPISNLLSILIFSSFLYVTLFMRLWAPIGVLLFFPAFAPQSQRYNYFKLMSKTGRVFSVLGVLIFVGSFLWALLPVPMPDLDRQIELWINAILIPTIIIYTYSKLRGKPINPEVQFEGLNSIKKLNRNFSIFKVIIIIVLTGISILSIMVAFEGNNPMYIFFVVAISINFVIVFIGWKQWSIILRKSIPLVEKILPELDDDKGQESDNHYWEGFSSGYFVITTLVMASLVFRRFSVYVAGFEYLTQDPTFLMNLTIGLSLFLTYMVAWVYYWLGTKGIHSVWHVLTVLLQKYEISGPVQGLEIPEKNEYLEIGNTYKKTVKILTALLCVYYLISGLFVRAIVIFLLFGIFGPLFAKIYLRDVNEDHDLIQSFNSSNLK